VRGEGGIEHVQKVQGIEDDPRNYCLRKKSSCGALDPLTKVVYISRDLRSLTLLTASPSVIKILPLQ
jgi:hypothetical protein